MSDDDPPTARRKVLTIPLITLEKVIPTDGVTRHKSVAKHSATMEPRKMLFVDMLISTKDDFQVGPSGQVGSNRSGQERLQVAPRSAEKRARSSGGSELLTSSWLIPRSRYPPKMLGMLI